MHCALYQNSFTKPVVLLVHMLPLLFFAGTFLLTTDSVRVVSRPLILTGGLRVTSSTEVISKVVTERSNSLSAVVATRSIIGDLKTPPLSSYAILVALILVANARRTDVDCEPTYTQKSSNGCHHGGKLLHEYHEPMVAAWCSLAPQHRASQMSERVCATCRLSPIPCLVVVKATFPFGALEDSKDSACHSAVLESADGPVSFRYISFEPWESRELRACAFTC